MLSNLSVIALSFVVILSGVALLPISFIPLIPKYLSWLLTWEIRIMNRIIVFVEKLPCSVTEDIDFHIVQVVLLYGVIGCICYLLYHRSRSVFWVANALFTIFCCSFTTKKLILDRETDFTAYHIRKCSVLEFSSHGQTVWFSDSLFGPEDNLYRYNIQSHARRHHLHGATVPLDTLSYDTPFLCKRGNLIRFDGKNYFILTKNQKTVPKIPSGQLSVDCLLLYQNPRLKPEELEAALPFKSVVADGSNTPFYIDRWRVFCTERSIPFSYTGDRNLGRGR